MPANTPSSPPLVSEKKLEIALCNKSKIFWGVPIPLAANLWSGQVFAGRIVDNLPVVIIGPQSVVLQTLMNHISDRMSSIPWRCIVHIKF